MSDEDLVKRLRTSWDAQRSIMLQTDAWMSERHLAADHIEQLTAKLAKAEGGMREIAAECGCSIARATLAALKGESHD